MQIKLCVVIFYYLLIFFYQILFIFKLNNKINTNGLVTLLYMVEFVITDQLTATNVYGFIMKVKVIYIT